MWRVLWLGALLTGQHSQLQHDYHQHNHHQRDHHQHDHQPHSEHRPMHSMRYQRYHKIIFPAIEQYDECYVDGQRTEKGTCKTLAACPKAVDRWHFEGIRPETCYFDKFEQFVCCESKDQSIYTREADRPDANRPTENTHEELINSKYNFSKACDDPDLPFQPAVVNGLPTKYNEYPFMAALGWKTNYGKDMISYQCGGALISPKFVLTAAHCTERGGVAPVVVRLGGVNLTDSDIIDHNIKEIHVHSNYNPSTLYNDIALVEIQERTYESPVCITHKSDLPLNEVTTIGYGHTKFAGVQSNQLLKAKLQIVPNADCDQYYRDTLPNGVLSSQICAKDPTNQHDTCQGDSGGPIVMQIAKTLRAPVVHMVGITSFGIGCAHNTPSIYTRVSAYMDWIQAKVWTNE